MIHVSETLASCVEYLIEQSLLGNHILFSNEDLRRAMRTHPCAQDLYAVEHHLERVFHLVSHAERRAYLEGLPETIYDQVVRTYLTIIENNLYENAPLKH